MSGIDWDLVRRTAEKVDGWPEWKKGSPKNERTAAMTTKEQTAKKYAQKFFAKVSPDNDDPTLGADDAELLESIILSALQEAEQWVSVSEPPDEGTPVMIRLTWGVIRGQVKRRRDYFEMQMPGMIHGYEIGEQVTHWRPLPPSPPEGK